jgi:hypothetical protein
VFTQGRVRRELRFFGELDRFPANLFDFIIDLLDLLVGERSFSLELAPEPNDRVALFPLLDLFLASIALRIGNRVAPESICLGLDHFRSLVRAYALGGPFDGLVDLDCIHAVYYLPVDVVAGCALTEILGR